MIDNNLNREQRRRVIEIEEHTELEKGCSSSNKLVAGIDILNTMHNKNILDNVYYNRFLGYMKIMMYSDLYSCYVVVVQNNKDILENKMSEQIHHILTGKWQLRECLKDTPVEILWLMNDEILDLIEMEDEDYV